MKQKLLLVVTMLFMMTAVMKAQVFESQSQTRAADGQIWWGYFTESDTKGSDFQGVGVGSKADYEAAIFIPANHAIAGGGTIKAIRLWLGSDYLSHVTGLKVWIAKKLTNYAEGAAYVQDVSVASLKVGANDIELTTPFAVNNEAIYVGYTMKLNAQAYAVMNGGQWVENSFFIRSSVSVTEWGPLSNFGKLALQILLEGVELKSNSITPSDFGTSYVLKGESVPVSVKITNTGKDPVTSISYTVSTDGVPSAEKTVTMNSLTFNTSTTISISLPADDDTKRYKKTLTVTKVNGKDNEASVKSANGSLITIIEKPEVVPVVEEFTGTWCGWCPIGFAGMEAAHKKFGDQTVLIAVHSSDVMEIADYYPIANRADGYPSSIVNRIVSIYPSEGNLNTYINKEKENVKVGAIQVKAAWADDGQKAIKVETATKFAYSDDQGQYGIALVLIEDGLKGTGSNWAQTNYLSGNSKYQSYTFWYNAASKVTGLEYNHIPVGAWNIENGADGSVSPTFNAGETLKYSQALDITSKSLIQDKSKLKVAALLIDRTTGGIVNAAQTSIEAPAPAPSETFEFRYEGKTLEDGATVTINAEEDSFGFGEMECATNPSSNPKNGLVLATSDGSQKSGSATLTIINKTFTAQMIQWCMGGECVPMNDKTTLTKSFATGSDGTCQVQFDATNIKTEGVLEARLTATIGSETKTVNIKFVYEKTNGIRAIYSEGDSGVWYDLNGTRLDGAPIRKGVYIINGKKVVK